MNLTIADLSAVFQALGGTFFVSAGQSAFSNKLRSTVKENAPSVDPARVVLTGATEIRTTFPPQALPGILRSYLAGLRVVFALGIALGGVAVVIAVLSPGGRINVKRAFGIDEESKDEESKDGESKDEESKDEESKEAETAS